MGFLSKCPHCNQEFEIVELNCRIFRCGILKQTYEQINPHLQKEICDMLVEKNLIFGCGKPFYINIKKNVTEICDYI